MPASPSPVSAPISSHADQADALLRRGFGPRVRRLHSRIGKAHHQAEGMTFSRALLEHRAQPGQIAALLCALQPVYALLEREGPALASVLGATAIPWHALARSTALSHDLATLSVLSPLPPSGVAERWLERIQWVAAQEPHRLMAHIYLRYGGDLSGGQRLGQAANAILHRNGMPALTFWIFDQDPNSLKQALHQGIEQLVLAGQQEEELLEEADLAFDTTQQLLGELDHLEGLAWR